VGSILIILGLSYLDGNRCREAIVNTPTDAVRIFFGSGMDALVIGSYVVEK
jgi:predicted NodU family carbamoyl transferase